MVTNTDAMQQMLGDHPGDQMGDQLGSQENAMQRGVPELPAQRVEYIKDWHKKIKKARDRHWGDQFEKMRRHMRFARGEQWPGWSEKDDRYVCNIVLRHIQKRTAALYAKNPRFITKRRHRMEFAVWDERPETLQLAYQNPEDPVMAAVLEDFHIGMMRRSQLDAIAKTLEYMFGYFTDEDLPPFKPRLKQLVRRAITNGVGYLKLGFQRAMQKNPDLERRVLDFSARLRELEMLTADLTDNEIQEASKEMERLRLSIESVQREAEVILKEGLVFDFPPSTQIIVDPACVQLRGFIGAKWIAQEYYFSKEQVKKIYGVDIQTNYEGYSFDKKHNPMAGMGGTDDDRGLACCWELYDLENGLVLHLADGYEALLDENTEPQVKLEQGHPFFTLTFNDVEDDKNIYPPSDTELLIHQACEYNRSREAFREHRIANKPAWISPSGIWDDKDLTTLGEHVAHELMQLRVPLTPNLDINKLLIAKPVAAIDQNIYNVEHLFVDVLRSTGEHEATFGGSSGDTATEVSVAESSRVSSVESNIDDLDDFLTEMSRAAGYILLMNMGPEQAKRIVGPGAVWPEFSAQEAAEEIVLEIQAGSSGRPNKAAELANMERVMPFVVQMPGINPNWLARELLKRLDDKLDLTDAFAEGMPSIIALNAMFRASQKQHAARGPEGDHTDNTPEAQGEHGGAPPKQPMERPPGPQPLYPGQSPTTGVM